MITLLDGAKSHVIALEITGGYNNDDEKSLEKLFEEKLDMGFEKVNILVKLDQLDLMKTSWKAAWHDGLYALKHIKYCGKLGDSFNPQNALEPLALTREIPLTGLTVFDNQLPVARLLVESIGGEMMLIQTGQDEIDINLKFPSAR